ncbi:hypothetical protein GS458_1702 [Geobacillus stearothermophilus]|nr:hypothetical protein GS458_1702 [Geobacillus stearothermophilus]
MNREWLTRRLHLQNKKTVSKLWPLLHLSVLVQRIWSHPPQQQRQIISQYFCFLVMYLQLVSLIPFYNKLNTRMICLYLPMMLSVQLASIGIVFAVRSNSCLPC